MGFWGETRERVAYPSSLVSSTDDAFWLDAETIEMKVCLSYTIALAF